MEPKVLEGRVRVYIYAEEVKPEVVAQVERIKNLPLRK